MGSPVKPHHVYDEGRLKHVRNSRWTDVHGGIVSERRVYRADRAVFDADVVFPKTPDFSRNFEMRPVHKIKTHEDVSFGAIVDGDRGDLNPLKNVSGRFPFCVTIISEKATGDSIRVPRRV